ncbi:MAG: hypothetical protein R3B06_00335 [Kofleriaceae bacterium]
MLRRRTAFTMGAIVVVAGTAGVVASRLLAPPARGPDLPTAASGDAPAPGPARLRWLVDAGRPAAVPDLVVHPPVVVGDRLLVAGARAGYVALDLATGALAWRRPSGAELSAPLVRAPHDVLLVHRCDDAIGVEAGRAVVACFGRIDPIDIAGRAAGAVHAPVAVAAPCLSSGAPWQLTADGDAVILRRGDSCALRVTLPDGRAEAIAPAPPLPAPPDPDCERLADGQAWCQRVDGGRSEVEYRGVRLPGLALLAAATAGDLAAVVIRRDATLVHDDLVALVGGRVAWTWPLPAPAVARATPVAVTVDATGIYAMFDGTRVAALERP